MTEPLRIPKASERKKLFQYWGSKGGKGGSRADKVRAAQASAMKRFGSMKRCYECGRVITEEQAALSGARIYVGPPKYKGMIHSNNQQNESTVTHEKHHPAA